jgi:hypothetical protein
MRKLRCVGVLAVMVGALFAFPGLAQASMGTVLADIAPPAAIGGAGVAFDGQYLYYTDISGSVLHRISPSGVPATDVPLLGGVAISTITYDASHDVLWGVDATGLNVYRIEKDGWAWIQFTLIPVLDLSGSCNSLAGCSTTVSGLAYDGTDDSLWYVPQGSQRVYHFNTAGQSLGYFDTANIPDCSTNGVTGIAAGASVLYLTAGTCSRGFQYTKTGTKLSSFQVGGMQSAAASCDNATFLNTTALWVRDAANGHLRAIEIVNGTCALGGGANPPDTTTRWMSGGGLGLGSESILFPGETDLYQEIDIKTPFAFHLLCDQGGGPPNNFVVNWKDSRGNHFSFHLEVWTPGLCIYDGTTPAAPPPCSDPDCFNKMIGSGLGRLTARGPNGQLLPIGGPCNPRTGDTARCGSLEPFNATDRGEPNTIDDSEFVINDPVQGGILSVCACLHANFQAHQRTH